PWPGRGRGYNLHRPPIPFRARATRKAPTPARRDDCHAPVAPPSVASLAHCATPPAVALVATPANGLTVHSTWLRFPAPVEATVGGHSPCRPEGGVQAVRDVSHP